MAVNLSIINFGQYARVAPRPAVDTTPSRQAAQTPANIAELSLSRYQLLRLRDALESAMSATGAAKVSSLGTAEVKSGSPLILDNSTRAALLRSSQEINTAETSFSPFAPAWTRLGTSTAQAIIGGVYDGSNGAGELRFRVRRAGVHGEDRLRIRVRDPDNRNIRVIQLEASDPLNQIYDVGNGLTLQLGPGSLVRNDEFRVSVSDTLGSVVNTTLPFGGIGNDNPNLDFGQSVGNGTLTINGVDIPVTTADSIDTVLSAINQSAANVTAVFDPATEGLVLTQKTPGSTPSIDIQADGSGFAAATKLAGAIVTPGKDPDLTTPLSAVTQFQDVQSGTINVNGNSVAIDVATDSLADVLARINSTPSDVSASYAEPPQRVAFESRRPISLDDGATGFLGAINIAPGSYSGRGNSISGGRAARITAAVSAVANALNTFLGGRESGSATGPTARQLAAVVADFVPGDGQNVFGLRFAPGDVLRVKGSTLSGSLGRQASETLAFLNGGDSADGFLGAAFRTVDQAIASLNERLGLRGSTVDQFV